MPYSSIDELPQHIKKYSSKLQRMWLKVFNSTYGKTNDEGRAFRAANSVLKKRMEKFGADRYGYESQFQCFVDDFLGNLNG